MSAPATGVTVAGLVAAATECLAGLPGARIEAERLMAHSLGVGRTAVLASGREPLDAARRAAFEALLRRRVSGEPLAYILGRTWFGDLSLEVTPDVLIPRPETELLADWSVAWCRSRLQPTAVLDVGTGSGALALAVAAGAARADVTATDVSLRALGVAARNARRLGYERRVHLVAADLWPPARRRYDLVVANLPYVGTGDGDLAAEVADWEPHLALFAGPDGLSLIRRLLAEAPTRLRRGGALGLEIGWRQGAAVTEMAVRAFPAARVTLHPDLEGRDRMVTVETDV